MANSKNAKNKHHQSSTTDEESSPNTQAPTKLRRQVEKKHGLDWQFCKRLYILSATILFGNACSTASFVLYGLLLLAAVEQVFIYYIGLIPSKFYAILIPKNVTGFRFLVINSMLFIGGKAVIAALLTFATAVLYITWRRRLNQRMHKLYLNSSTKSYYYFNILRDAGNTAHVALDNPDQRMTQDVDKFCLQLSTVVAPVLTAPFKIAWYAYQTYIVTGMYGPLVIFGYFIIGTIVNKYVMSPIINYIYEQEHAEGDFRYKHMQIRAYAESTAFYRSEQTEYIFLNRRLTRLLRVLLAKARWQSCLSFSLSIFDYFGGILSYILLAVPLFAGRFDNLQPSELSALISKNGFVCIMLVSSFSTLVDLANQAAEIAGNLHRVAQLLENLNDRYAESRRPSNNKCDQSPPSTTRRRRRCGQNCNSNDDDAEIIFDDKNNFADIPAFHSINTTGTPALTTAICSGADGEEARALSNPSPQPSLSSSLSSPPLNNRYSAFCSTMGTPTSSSALTVHYSPSTVDSGTTTDSTLPTTTTFHPMSNNANDNNDAVSLSIELCNLTFGVPTNAASIDQSSKMLVSNLNLLIRRGRNILVSGPSSSGKTSLLRVLLSMWPLHAGRILFQCTNNAPNDGAGIKKINNNATVLTVTTASSPCAGSKSQQRVKNRLLMCLPQKPLVVSSGSLRQQLIYPELVAATTVDNSTESKEENAKFLLELLQYVKLEHLLTTLVHNDFDWDPSSSSSSQTATSSSSWQWEDVLSPGEQQRLSFIRIFYHRPQFALLDEATSAVEPAMEERLYRKAKQLGITLVSVGHRESLRQFHDVELKLDGNGGWILCELHHSSNDSLPSLEKEDVSKVGQHQQQRI